MKHVSRGDNIKISRSDVEDIRRVAMDRQNTRIQNANNAPDLQYDFVLVKNTCEFAISKYSVIGIEAPKMNELKYDNYYYDPEYDPEEKYNPIEYNIKNNGVFGMLYIGVLPDYKNNQSSFGILQSDIGINEIGWCAVSGYTLAIFDNKTEYIRDRMQVRLRPETEIDISSKTKINIPLIFDSDQTGGDVNIRNSYGSPILIQPGTLIKKNNISTIPEGLQIANIWLGTSFNLFWDALWIGKL